MKPGETRQHDITSAVVATNRARPGNKPIPAASSFEENKTREDIIE